MVVGRRLSAAAAAALVFVRSAKERDEAIRNDVVDAFDGDFVVDTREEDTFEKEENFVDFITW